MSKIRYYKLDLRGCDRLFLENLNGVVELPLMDGQYEREFDLVEDQIPVDLCNKFRHEDSGAKDFINMVGLYHGECGLRALDHMPMGLDSSNLPEGAKLIRLVS